MEHFMELIMYLPGENNMLDHVVSGIRSAKFDNEPWPHLQVLNVFPDDFYAAMLDQLPSKEQMEPLGQSTPTRRLYWLVKDGTAAVGVLPFWNAFCAVLFPQLRLELETKFNVECGYVGAELVNDFPTYYIGPHTDAANKLITGLFYLPRTDENAKQGTQLYSGTEADPRGKGHKFSDEFKLVKPIPYVPNTALFFKRTDISFHGVRPTPVERWSLAYDLFRE
jgi:hypothetical protein